VKGLLKQMIINKINVKMMTSVCYHC